MLVNDLKSPGERTKEINRELEANAAEIETLIATGREGAAVGPVSARAGAARGTDGPEQAAE